MKNSRSIAIWVAVLFVMAMAASVVGDIMLAPIKQADAYLPAVAENTQRVVSVFLLFVIACAAIIAIPIVFFLDFAPAQPNGVADYIAARFAEALLFLFGGLFTLSSFHWRAPRHKAMPYWLSSRRSASTTIP